MKKQTVTPYPIDSISDLHRLLQLPGPLHPLISVVNFKDITCFTDQKLSSVLYRFYSICIKKDFKGKIKYGRNYYDFDEGIMTFFAPGQVVSTEITDDMACAGWWLVVHPDFMRNYPLAKTIKEYGYFSYAVNEALHLSEKEEEMVASIMQHIEQEYRSLIDSYSQDVIISQIELLLTYANRFYNRQFITRKHAGSDLLIKLEQLLADYFNGDDIKEKGLPTVHDVAQQLNVSSHYLSDMLRSTTGHGTQHYIHDKLIEKAKETLAGTSLSVGEIAYQLGFEHPQSFSKLFKSKTAVSPLEFRSSFN